MEQCITLTGDMDSGDPELKRPEPGPGPEVIYCNILPRLPFWTLAHLAAVCKTWRDLILRDATFAAMQA
ncbi:hypothetical protein EJB05_06310 [Eragrostis curvula]|uniref:F-box domain-containing protein n=1 Tax=Eragrostis curvula TaxID=38414 RepID=A0A5J9WFE0_9POAL|nr:hypothetical protein EJB05_06310 [Eragrostis curvula]